MHRKTTDQGFQFEMLTIGKHRVRVGRQSGRNTGKPPLLLFNGIGGNIEMLAPIATWMPEREVISFDIPGVGHSPLPDRPYRVSTIAKLAAGVIQHYGHEVCDVLGVSWGGGVAQEFARTCKQHCRRVILCATSSGMIMFPSHPKVALKMATPKRYQSKDYARQNVGHLYGGDFRSQPEIAEQHLKNIRWQSRLGYYFQLFALIGWTSVHWLRTLSQPVLILAGDDDPLIPLMNPRLMHCLIPQSELQVLDCGHLFLLTRPEESAQFINEFLDRPEIQTNPVAA